MIERIKRSLAGGIVVTGLVTALVLGASVPAWAAEVDTVPTATAGSIVEVSGSADTFLLPAQVKLCWNEPGCSDLGTVDLPALQTRYSTTVIIPSNAAPGHYRIYACTSLLSCASAPIEVVVPDEPSTTTTVATTPTTAPPPTTTATTRPAATTTTTRSVSPAAPETTTTVGGGRTTSSIVPNGATGDPAQIQVAAQTTNAPGDTSPETEQTEKSPSTPTTTTTTRYRPPTTTNSPSAAPSTTLDTEDSRAVIEVAAGDEDQGLTYDPRLVLWTLWLLATVVAGGVVSTLWWIAGKRRQAE